MNIDPDEERALQIAAEAEKGLFQRFTEFKVIGCCTVTDHESEEQIREEIRRREMAQHVRIQFLYYL